MPRLPRHARAAECQRAPLPICVRRRKRRVLAVDDRGRCLGEVLRPGLGTPPLMLMKPRSFHFNICARLSETAAIDITVHSAIVNFVFCISVSSLRNKMPAPAAGTTPAVPGRDPTGLQS